MKRLLFISLALFTLIHSQNVILQTNGLLQQETISLRSLKGQLPLGFSNIIPSPDGNHSEHKPHRAANGSILKTEENYIYTHSGNRTHRWEAHSQPSTPYNKTLNNGIESQLNDFKQRVNEHLRNYQSNGTLRNHTHNASELHRNGSFAHLGSPQRTQTNQVVGVLTRGWNRPQGTVTPSATKSPSQPSSQSGPFSIPCKTTEDCQSAFPHIRSLSDQPICNTVTSQCQFS